MNHESVRHNVHANFGVLVNASLQMFEPSAIVFLLAYFTPEIGNIRNAVRDEICTISSEDTI